MIGLTDCGVGCNPTVLDAGAQIIERQLDTVHYLLVSHRQLGLILGLLGKLARLAREQGGSCGALLLLGKERLRNFLHFDYY